jgi:hypothetical protein
VLVQLGDGLKDILKNVLFGGAMVMSILGRMLHCCLVATAYPGLYFIIKGLNWYSIRL